MQYFEEHRERGGNLIVADPRRTPTAQNAAVFLQLTPGTDGALANGLLYVAIEEHLTDLGLDVLVRDGTQFLVSWDEPEGNIDEVIEAIWSLHGDPFEVTQEEFHRQNLLHLNHDDGDDAAEASGDPESAAA